MNKLFLVHLGYYDEISNGVYECHTNLFIVASDFDEAKVKVKQIEIVKQKKMHIDGLQLIEAVGGYSIILALDESLNGVDKITNNKSRELDSKPNINKK